MMNEDVWYMHDEKRAVHIGAHTQEKRLLTEQVETWWVHQINLPCSFFFPDKINFNQDQKANQSNNRWLYTDPSNISHVMHTKFHTSVMVLEVVCTEGHIIPSHFFQQCLIKCCWLHWGTGKRCETQNRLFMWWKDVCVSTGDYTCSQKMWWPKTGWQPICTTTSHQTFDHLTCHT